VAAIVARAVAQTQQKLDFASQRAAAAAASTASPSPTRNWSSKKNSRDVSAAASVSPARRARGCARPTASWCRLVADALSALLRKLSCLISWRRWRRRALSTSRSLRSAPRRQRGDLGRHASVATSIAPPLRRARRLRRAPLTRAKRVSPFCAPPPPLRPPPQATVAAHRADSAGDQCRLCHAHWHRLERCAGVARRASRHGGAAELGTHALAARRTASRLTSQSSEIVYSKAARHVKAARDRAFIVGSARAVATAPSPRVAAAVAAASPQPSPRASPRVASAAASQASPRLPLLLLRRSRLLSGRRLL
jgi:hypothetical protein